MNSEKHKLKHFLSTHPFFSRLHLTPFILDFTTHPITLISTGRWGVGVVVFSASPSSSQISPSPMWVLSMVCSYFMKYPPALAWDPPWAAVWISPPLCSPPWAAGKYLLHHGLLHGLQDNLCSCTCSILCHSICSDLSICRAVSHTISPHSSLPCSILNLSQICFSEELPFWLLGLAMPCSGAVGAGCVRHGVAPASPHRGAQQHLGMDIQHNTLHSKLTVLRISNLLCCQHE